MHAHCNKVQSCCAIGEFLTPHVLCADNSIQINVDALCADVLYIHDVYVDEHTLLCNNLIISIDTAHVQVCLQIDHAASNCLLAAVRKL